MDNGSSNEPISLIGMDLEGWSMWTHYKFINGYRTNSIYDETFVEYLKKVEYTFERQEEIDRLNEAEALTIQLEMLIYLKIWESDSFIKKFYQLTRLIHGESYDWHFKISESNRDSGATGSRQEIIRLLTRDRLENHIADLSGLFQTAFITQLRNSIAHSKYSIMGRHIQLNNTIQNDPASQLRSLTFETWTDIFHETMSLYNEFIGIENRIAEYYAKLAHENNNRLEIRITRQDPEERIEYNWLQYHPKQNRWTWYRDE